MSKKIFKYTGRVIWGLITLLCGLMTWCAFNPMEGYHHCEAGQEELSSWYSVLITIASLIAFCFVWYKTRKW